MHANLGWMMRWRGFGSLLLAVALVPSCFLRDDDELPEDRGLCFETVRTLPIDQPLAAARWLHGDIESDGRGDLVAIHQQTDAWSLQVLSGTADDPEPFVLGSTMTWQTTIPLEEARIVFADANGDGQTDLATYHNGRIVIIPGPLQGELTAVETEIDGLGWARGEFIDFDEDGVLDFVMREGNGDNLVSYRGLREGGFELAGTAEFHEDIYCINQILAEDRDDDWFVVEASDVLCGQELGDLRIAVFALEDDGSIREIAAQLFDKDLTDRDLRLRAVGNMLSEYDHEILINDSIWAVDGSEMLEVQELPSDRRGDFDGDGVLDHAEGYGSVVKLRMGGSRSIQPGEDIEWEVAAPTFDVLRLVEAVDVNGDGLDDIVGQQTVDDEFSLVVGTTPYRDCD